MFITHRVLNTDFTLQRLHEKHPFIFQDSGAVHSVDYNAGESTSVLFGGNSNWRGPIWLPCNWLLIEALSRYHYFYGSTLTVECPTGSGVHMNLSEVAEVREEKAKGRDREGERY